MIKKIVTIDGKEVPFRASATIPRLYRAYFNRDIFKDISKLKEVKSKTENGTSFEINDLELFENVAYIMAKHADPDIPNTPDEWLEQFNMFSIYEILPEILDLWALDNKTMIDSKKKFMKVAEK